jgi:fermentation-respiration switch protein FrsA (DUF1100 family)
MEMMRFLIILVVSGMLFGCRLDDNLFNPDTNIEVYQFDDYEGIQEIDLPSEYDIPMDEVRYFRLVSGKVGEEIACVFIGDTGRISRDTIFVYCHGNTGHMDYYWPRTKLLANVHGKLHHLVLTFDYRGFGLSDGKPSESNMYEDLEACLTWLKEHGMSSDRVVIYGFSLGSAPACQIAANPLEYSLAPAKIILENPFASAAVMVEDGSGLSLPSSYFTNLKIDNAEEIKKVNADFLWLHGKADDFLQLPTHGQPVYDNYGGRYKEAHLIDEAGHGDLPFIWGYPSYLNAVEGFINR